MTSNNSRRAHITRDETSGVPIMLTQAIVVAIALIIGEIICAPLYVSFAPTVFPLIPWAMVAIVLAVMFSYIVGFALLWCAESFAYRMNRRFQPIVYATIGAIGFGVWTTWVIVGVMNMITAPLGAGIISGQHQTMATINGALLGLAAFFAAFTLADRIAKHRRLVIILGVITLVLAAIGAYILAMMLRTVA